MEHYFLIIEERKLFLLCGYVVILFRLTTLLYALHQAYLNLEP